MGALTQNFYLSPNVWNYIQFTFASLTPGNVPFDPAQLSAVEFQPVNAGVFDLWIDDVQFY